MPYISNLYQDFNDENEEYTKGCRFEEENGNIPVILVKGRLTLKFYVSPDTTIQYILNTFHHEKIKNMNDIKTILYVTYNPESKEFENGKRIVEYDVPLQEISTKRIKLMMQLNQETHLL